MMVQRGSLEPNSLFHQIMETLMEGIAITNVRGQVVFANQALEQLLGYGPGELLGQPCTKLFVDDLGAAYAGACSDAPSRYDVRLLHKRGTSVPVVVSSFRLSDGDREAGTLSTFSDLRETHHLPGQLMDGDAPAAAGQRIASIVHELNNSLSILTLQAQVLYKKGNLTPRVKESLYAMQDEALRMTTLVDSLRAAADPHSIQLKPTDINMLITRTLESQRPLMEEAGIRLELDLDAALPTTEADPLRLQQVFINLVNNSRQAIEASPGRGRLAIGTRLVDTGNGSPNIQVRFSDNGPGIPAEVMPHIFEPFYTTKRGNGMGLGLPICQQIVEKHGGRIWAEEALPSGAAFVLELPVVEVVNQNQNRFLSGCDFQRLDGGETDGRAPRRAVFAQMGFPLINPRLKTVLRVGRDRSGTGARDESCYDVGC